MGGGGRINNKNEKLYKSKWKTLVSIAWAFINPLKKMWKRKKTSLYSRCFQAVYILNAVFTQTIFKACSLLSTTFSSFHVEYKDCTHKRPAICAISNAEQWFKIELFCCYKILYAFVCVCVCVCLWVSVFMFLLVLLIILLILL
jgi:hypothetical protein